LTFANHLEVLDAARHKSKREIEHLVARLSPQIDVRPAVRKLPAPGPAALQTATLVAQTSAETISAETALLSAPVIRRPEIKPIAPERFKVQFTVSRETYEKLRRAQDLMRHSVPSSDPAAIFDRALTLLLAELSKQKLAAAKHPRPPRSARAGSRHIPAAVRREVWQRDGGRCAFRGDRGRCAETALEFHHVVAFAKGGTATGENIELRCRAHNLYEAERDFPDRPRSLLAREAPEGYCVRNANSVRTESEKTCNEARAAERATNHMSSGRHGWSRRHRIVLPQNGSSELGRMLPKKSTTVNHSRPGGHYSWPEGQHYGRRAEYRVRRSADLQIGRGPCIVRTIAAPPPASSGYRQPT
jgi:hypothetical protein